MSGKLRVLRKWDISDHYLESCACSCACGYVAKLYRKKAYTKKNAPKNYLIGDCYWVPLMYLTENIENMDCLGIEEDMWTVWVFAV